MAEWTTIPVTPETKELLEKLKKMYNTTYDEIIKSVVGPRESITLDLSRTVPAKTGILWYENYREVPWDGVINQITLHFPKGCNGLVWVRIGVSGKRGLIWICPREGFIALDDTTQSYTMQYPVNKGDRIVAEIYNYDELYDHTIGIIVGLISRPFIYKL